MIYTETHFKYCIDWWKCYTYILTIIQFFYFKVTTQKLYKIFENISSCCLRSMIKYILNLK